MESKPKQKLFYADLIRVTAVFMVMLLHSAATLLGNWGKEPLDFWLWGNGFDSLVRSCVPLFVMLSGALILGRTESLGSFFSKRFSRLLLPFALWVAAYINWRIFYIGEVLPVDKIILGILKGPVYYHLWYLYMVMGLYLITPFLRSVIAAVKESVLRYFLLLWLVFNSILPLICYLVWLYAGYTVVLGLKVPMVAGYAGYYIWGYLLNKRPAPARAVPVWWITYGVSSLLIFGGTWLFTDAAGSFQAILYDYFSPLVVLQSTALFLLLSHYGRVWEPRVSDRVRGLFAQIGQLSLGMYLVHVMFLELLGDGGLGFKLNGGAFLPALAVPMTALLTFAVSYGSMLLLARIPLLKYAVVERPSKTLAEKG